MQGKLQLMDCGGETVAVFRDGCVTYTDGKPVKSPGEEYCATGSLQPMGGRDLLLVPEGDRYKEQLWFFTSFCLKLNDRVRRCGVNYQVQSVQDWSTFFQARLMRIDLGKNATP